MFYSDTSDDSEELDDLYQACETLDGLFTSLGIDTEKLDLIKSKVDTFSKSYADTETYNLIIKSFKNMTDFNPRRANQEIKKSFKQNAQKAVEAVAIYVSQMTNKKLPAKCKEIDEALFKLAFAPEEGKFTTRVFSVYPMHDEFIFGKYEYANFKSSTGSGKTRCAPFFFAIRAIVEKMKQPFFIMTQPSASIIHDKIVDFKNTLGDKVIIESRYDRMIELYKKKPRKPVICLFSPHNALKLITNANEEGIDIFAKTRFCLDEIHERTVDTDVLVAKLGEQTRDYDFNLKVLMMSATPDERVLKCFKQVEQLQLEDSQLFPIQDFKYQVKKHEINAKVVESTQEIIQKMANGSFNRGHILIFTSGNARINAIMGMLTNKIQDSKLATVKILKNMESHMANMEEFVRELDKKNLDRNNLYILPIKYTSFAPQGQRMIAKDPIPNHKNVVKVIVATNGIESSITINELAAVVDSGLVNLPSYDKDKGLTIINEEQITKMSQIQRRGRVGRIRDGIAVQITLEGKTVPDNLPPEILTTDICSSILSLRMMGIKLEDIKNLPDKIGKEEMNYFISSLKSYKALDRRNKITDIGKEIGKYESLSPFIASAIINFTNKLVHKDLRRTILSLIVLIFSSDDLVLDQGNTILQQNFYEDSDIVTLLVTLLDIGATDTWKKGAEDAGLNPKRVVNILSSAKQIAENFGYVEENVFQRIKANYNVDKMMRVTTKIIEMIGENKKEWVECRRTNFLGISNIMGNQYTITYSGNQSLAFEGEETSEIVFGNLRPGSTSLVMPGSAYILCISHNIQQGKNYGTYIHKDFSRSETVHPVTLKGDKKLCNPFAYALIESFIGDDAGFQKMYRFSPSTGAKGGNMICSINMCQDKAAISFIPLQEESKKIMQIAIIVASRLFRYTPATIAIRHETLQCAVCVSGKGTNRTSTNIYFFKEKKVYPYALNRKILMFLYKNTAKLKSIEQEISIAVTGEMLSFSFNELEYENNGMKNPMSNSICVFSDEPYFYSNLFILSKKEIPGETPLKWTKSGVYAEYTNEDIIARASAVIYRDFVRVSSAGKLILFLNNTSKLSIKGTLPDLAKHDIQITTDSKVRLSKILDGYNMLFNKNEGKGKIDFQEFSFEGKSFLGKAIFLKNTASRNHKLPPDDFVPNVQINKKFLNLFRESIALKGEYNKTEKDPQRQKEINERLKEIEDERNALPVLSQYHQPMNYSSYCKLKSIENILKHPHYKNLGKGCAAVVVNETQLDEKIEECIDIAKKIDSSTYIDTVPIYGIKVFHGNGSLLSEDEFMELVKNVLGKYGKIIDSISEYETNDKDKRNKGYVFVRILTCEFISPISEDLGKALNQKLQEFKIPPSFNFPPAILDKQSVKEAFAKWFEDNHLDIKQIARGFYGSKSDVEKAENLFADNKEIGIPFITVAIPGGVNIDNVARRVKLENKRLPSELKLFFNKNQRTFTYHKNLPPDKIRDIIFKEHDHEDDVKEETILGDEILCCENPLQSRNQVFIYKRDGTYEAYNFCATCVQYLLKNNLGTLFDDANDSVKMRDVLGNQAPVKDLDIWPCKEDTERHQLWPLITFGQLIWNLVSEPMTANTARAYVTALASKVLHNPLYVTFCPCHPEVVFKRQPEGTTIHCNNKLCKMFLCPKCNRWHLPGKCAIKRTLIPPGFRICPGCKNIVEKSEACNHIACTCGKHFCYYCGAGPFDNQNDCYSHLSKRHGGCFNDPPDYRKYHERQNVPDAELKAFYEKYPKIKKRTDPKLL